MTTDDDARDLLIHVRIEAAVRSLAWPAHKLSRPDALGALLACANGAGNQNIEHMIQAIIEGQGITREDLGERLSAVIELDREEEAERAARLIDHALELEGEGVA